MPYARIILYMISAKKAIPFYDLRRNIYDLRKKYPQGTKEASASVYAAEQPVIFNIKQYYYILN